MANPAPMWWMRGDQNPQQHPIPPPPPIPVPPPEQHFEPKCDCPPPEQQPPQNPNRSFAQTVSGLTERLRHADGETLLLLALIWLLYREKADHKLLLALAYILF